MTEDTRMPDMGRPFKMAFKVGDGYRVFQIISWRVRSDFDLTVEDVCSKTGEGTIRSSCTCMMFRVDKSCPHSDMIAKPAERWAYMKGSWVESDGVPDWREEGSKQFVALYDEGPEVTGVVHPDVGDLDLFNLMWLMTSGTTEKIKAAGGYLNPKRLYAECEAASKLGLAINAPDVQSAGKSVAPLVSVDVPDDFDKSLKFDEDSPKTESDLDEMHSKIEESVERMTVHPSKSKLPWKTHKRPDPSVFYVDRDTWEQCIYSVLKGKNILLTGPSGSGKSELTWLVAKAMSRDLVAFNMGAMSEPRSALIGNTHFDKEKGTWFEQSRFAKSVQHKEGVVLLDEMSRADRGAFNILLPLLDRQGYLALDESEDAAVIHKAEGMTFFATANVGMEYTGTDALDKALKERFDVTIDMFFPPPENEHGVLVGRCSGLLASSATRLVDIATTQRAMCQDDGDFIDMISTRMLIAAGEQIGAGMAFKTACKFCIENQFSNEGGDASERTKIMQIVQKGGA
jgi:MoxR-like ATPase